VAVPELPQRFQPRTTAGRAGLDALLADPSRAVVGLDFDGTLAPIVPDPAEARALPGAVPVLARLAPCLGGVVVVTGRPAADAADLAGFRGSAGSAGSAGAAGLDGLVVLGQYGAERWDASSGVLTSPPPPPAVQQAREALPGVLADAGAPDGTWVEDKGRALAVHTRRAPDPGAALERLRGPVHALAARVGLHVEPGRLVLEMRPAGMDKGGALTAFVGERGARSVLYAGDDLGDLPAYDAVEDLRAQDVPGVTVCSGSTEVAELARRADVVVDGPEGVVALLAALADALGRE